MVLTSSIKPPSERFKQLLYDILNLMKIGIDGRLWNETGVGRYIRNLVKNLAEIDDKNDYVLFVRDPQKVKVGTSPARNALPEAAASLQAGSHSDAGGNFKIVKADIRWHSAEEQTVLPGILLKENLDLMHFPYFSVPVLYHRKFVVTIHDLIIDHFSTGQATTLPLPFYRAKRIGYKLIMRQVAQKAAKIITVSNATKDEIMKLLKVSSDSIVVTHEGVDSGLYSSSEHKRVEKFSTGSNNTPYLLYVGNAYPHKNLERLIEAFSSVNKTSSAKLIFVGKEDYFYKRLKQQNLTSNIIFKDHVSDEELRELYRNAKALVIPSLMEGFGLPALEAMANGCLVIASDIPALREVCGEAAIYVNPFDPKDLADKMESVLKHDFSEKKTLGEKQAQKFSWEKMAKETLKIYQEVIG